MERRTGVQAAWTRLVQRERVDGGSRTSLPDQVAVEEPLEIRVAGVPLAVLLRTPGRDEDLATGFVLTEGVLSSVAHIDEIRPCDNAPADARGNIVDVMPAPGVTPDLHAFERPRFSNSACGVCGIATLDNLQDRGGPLDDARTLPGEWVSRAPRLLGDLQPAFRDTGGLHAAGLMDATGALHAVREDVGRHNAVDKSLGAWMHERPGEVPLALVTTSRAGFEIVQKAHALRVPVVITVGAPTSLAVDLAARMQLTLAAFVRGDTYGIYAHGQRIR